MLRIWAHLSTRPLAVKCAVIVTDWLVRFIIWLESGVPMEWPQ
jgi:hypothetical protein